MPNNPALTAFEVAEIFRILVEPQVGHLGSSISGNKSSCFLHNLH